MYIYLFGIDHSMVICNVHTDATRNILNHMYHREYSLGNMHCRKQHHIHVHTNYSPPNSVVAYKMYTFDLSFPSTLTIEPQVSLHDLTTRLWIHQTCIIIQYNYTLALQPNNIKLYLHIDIS